MTWTRLILQLNGIDGISGFVKVDQRLNKFAMTCQELPCKEFKEFMMKYSLRWSNGTYEAQSFDFEWIIMPIIKCSHDVNCMVRVDEDDRTRDG
jgi:hypothetical protein